MAFKQITPYIRLAPQVSASVRELINGDIVLWVSFSDVLLRAFKNPSKCTVGIDEESELIKIEFDNKGPFELAKFDKGGGRIRMEAFGSFKDGEHESDACAIEQRDDAERWIIVALPKAWRAPAPVARPKVVPPYDIPKTAAEPKPDGEDGVVGERLDAIKYLRAKGYKIDRLAGGWFQLNGQRTPKAVVVGLVDKERDRVDLPKIDASKVF